MKPSVLVIGAAGGVGLETVKLLAHSGYEVIATLSNNPPPSDIQSTLAVATDIIRLDLTHAEQVKSTLNTYLSHNSIHLAGVIVCAAVCPNGPLETMDLATLTNSFAINTLSHVAIFQACLPSLRAHQGRLVFISSLSGRIAGPMLGAYCASKFALEALVDVMRREVEPAIKICLLQPGGIKTKMAYQQLAAMQDRIDQLSIEESHRYRYLYEGFKTMLAGVENSIEPIVVANTALEALQSPSPLTRYPVGEDAVNLIAMAKTAEDMDIDQLFASLIPRY